MAFLKSKSVDLNSYVLLSTPIPKITVTLVMFLRRTGKQNDGQTDK